MPIHVEGDSVFVKDTPNTTTFARLGHTAKEAAVDIFKIFPPTNPSAGNATSGFEVRLVAGDLDADGVPREKNTLLYLVGSNPLANDAALMTHLIAKMKEIVDDPSILPNLINGIRPVGPTL